MARQVFTGPVYGPVAGGDMFFSTGRYAYGWSDRALELERRTWQQELTDARLHAWCNWGNLSWLMMATAAWFGYACLTLMVVENLLQPDVMRMLQTMDAWMQTAATWYAVALCGCLAMGANLCKQWSRRERAKAAQRKADALAAIAEIDFELRRRAYEGECVRESDWGY